MELFHHQTSIHFMKKRYIMAAVSLVVFIISIGFILTKGINFGLDFTGGTQLELTFSKQTDPVFLKKLLEKGGFKETKVTHYGSSQDILLRINNRSKLSEKILGQKIVALLKAEDPDLILKRIEFVGSEVGDELVKQGLLAVAVSLLAIMLYIALRFEYRLGISAVLALLHDPIVILGIFSALQIEFDLATLAAILAVIGYSLNDTIVVFDRVRENFKKIRHQSASEIMDLSINQTLSRTIMTSFMTLIVVVALFLFGGESLYGFSSALIIGIIVGTYSSIFIAGALAVQLGLKKTDVTKKAADELP